MSEFKGVILTAEELVRRRTKIDPVFPVKGPKCFSPSGSWLERKQLQSILDATKVLIAEERVERENALAQAEWDDNLKVARVTRVVGRQFEKFGHEENTTVFLYPEEALHLLETNHLQLLHGGVSMSIQQAYSVLIGHKTGCSFLEYMVFSHLLKNGFKVLRHCPKRTITRYERLIGLHQELPRLRKSKRKTRVPQKIIVDESKNKNMKRKNTAAKKETCSTPSDEKNLRRKTTNLKTNHSNQRKKDSTPKSEDEVPNAVCFETSGVSYLSSGSDIEILSEKNVLQNGNLEYNLSDSTSSPTHDSDCQVIFDDEVVKPPSQSQVCSSERIIEEINLDDSSENEIDSKNVEHFNFKSEIFVSEVMNSDDPTVHEENSFTNVNFKAAETALDVDRVNNKEYHDISDTFKNQIDSNKSSVNIAVLNFDRNVDEDTNANKDHVKSEEYCCISETFEDQMESSKPSINIPELNLDGNVGEDSDNEGIPSVHEMKVDSSDYVSSVKEETVNTTQQSSEEILFQSNINLLKCENQEVMHGIQQKAKEEIEVIDLDEEGSDDNENGSDEGSDESNITEDKATILSSFPNCAGCRVMNFEAPPQHLCPPNVSPFQPAYSIDLIRLQDPQYGGNPHKISRKESERNRGRNEYFNSSFNNMHRYRSYPKRRPYHYRNYTGRHGHSPWRRESNRWPENRNTFRNENHFNNHVFRDQAMAMNHHNSNGYSPVCPPPPYNFNNYGNFMPQLGPRRTYEYGRCLQSNFNQCHDSQSQRYSQRQAVASSCPNYYREFSNNESFNPNNYVPFNSENSNTPPQPFEDRRPQILSSTPIAHRYFEENNSDASPGSREQRGRRLTYSSVTITPQSSQQFLRNEHPDGENSQTSNVSSSQNQQQGSCEEADNEFAAVESESSEDSCSSPSSHESNTEKSPHASNNDSGEDGISVLLKPDDIDDMSVSLKSLELVQRKEFKGLTSVHDEPLLTIKFDIYQPSTPFRRSEPPVPDFRVVVMQPDHNLPTSRQLAFLGDGLEDDVPLLFAIASIDSVAFYLQSVINLPPISSKETF